MTEPSGIRYAHSGDVDIAYTVVGRGPIDLVLVTGFVSHLELSREIPPFARLADELSSFSRLVLLDKRGTGLSDRSLGFGSLAQRMDDVRAVMDAAGVERSAIYGISEGGPLALLFAATYPHRVTKLVLMGSFARLKWAPDHPIGNENSFEPTLELLEQSWGTGNVMRFVIQNTPNDALPLLARYERNTCTPKMAAEIMRKNTEIDIRDILPTINVPTLVLHHAGDPVVPVEHGRFVADHIPGARYIELTDPVHVSWDAQTMVPDEVRDFLLGDEAVPEPEIDRFLATVLFTDIVGSTKHTADLGDARWRHLLDRHDEMARADVERFRGRVVKTTGDGFLATFDSPTRGIHCAEAMCRSMKSLGLDLRAGVHTGEVERRGDDISGIGVVIARRICDIGGANDVLASRTVKELVMGSDVTFADRGPHQLKGVPDDWQLFAVAG